MIKTTFETLKKHPEIMIGILIVALIAAVAYLPIIMGIGNVVNNFEKLESGDVSAAHGVVMFFALAIILGIIGGGVMYFLAIPTLMNRVYEACSGTAEPGWIKRGIKRCWWKPFVTGLAISTASMVLSLALAIVNFIPVLGQLVAFAASIAFGVFSLIAYTATIAEDEFGTGLNNTFPVGWKYFFKMLGVNAVAMIIPIIILAVFMGTFMVNNMGEFYINNASNNAAEFSESLKLMKPMFVISGIVGLYTMLISPFIYTYSMHQYLSAKGIEPPKADYMTKDYVVQSRDMTL